MKCKVLCELERQECFRNKGETEDPMSVLRRNKRFLCATLCSALGWEPVGLEVLLSPALVLWF